MNKDNQDSQYIAIGIGIGIALGAGSGGAMYAAMSQRSK